MAYQFLRLLFWFVITHYSHKLIILFFTCKGLPAADFALAADFGLPTDDFALATHFALRTDDFALIPASTPFSPVPKYW